jgi:hypothetical protein
VTGGFSKWAQLYEFVMIRLLPSKMAQSVTFPNFILAISHLNPDLDTDYLVFFF